MGKMGKPIKVVDMHCDTISGLWRARTEGDPQSLLENGMHLDLKKMEAGHYLLQNFAMFVFLQEDKDPLVNVLELIDEYNAQLEANRDRVAPVLRYEDISRNAQVGKISAMLTIEEGGVLKGNVSVLRDLYRLGVRMLTLTWNFENELGYPNTVTKFPNYDPNRTYGLKPAGIEAVREMNRLGMIVDVSHLGDDGFWDVVKYSQAPFVASHSNAWAVCPHSRNLTDDMIRALADKGGVMGINFCGDFLNPNGTSRVEDMVRHIQHIRQVGGLGCIGLGTDFDGIDGDLEIRDGSYMPLLAQGLRDAGFHEREIEDIFHNNVLRLYKEVLR
jgi:membrane dipeptidase